MDYSTLTQEELVVVCNEYEAKIQSLEKFSKDRVDLLNWAKSELKQETNHKLAKTMTPQRTDKIIFLNRVLKWLKN